MDQAEGVSAFRARVADLPLPLGVHTKAAVSYGQAGETLTDVPALTAAGAVALSDDGEPLVHYDLLLQAFRAAGDLVLTAHCEETPRAAAKVAAVLGAGAPMCREAELIRLHLAALADAGTGRLHIQHVSLAASVELIAGAKRRGLAVTAEVTPHHLLLCAEEIPARDGGPDANWKMNPPLRGRADMLAMRRALADGVIDLIATDHAPHTVAEKAQGWDVAPFGIIGLETALGAVYSLVHDGTLTASQLTLAMATRPATLLPAWARSRGDLVLLDPAATWTVDPERFYSKARNCPFAGMTFTGKATHTIARGRLVMAEGVVLF
jgi:dihydroorotase